MALEPLYYITIVALLVVLVLQYTTIVRWRKAASHWRAAANQWRRLAGDYAHHQVSAHHVNRHSAGERTEDQ